MSIARSVAEVLLLLSAFLFALPVHAAPEWPLPDGVKSIEINGYEMAYQETGSGVPIVLVHGSMSDCRVWNDQVPEFAKKYRVIAVSLRHYFPEKWDGKGTDFSVGQHAADVTASIKKLNLGRVHLLGWSRGGSVVLNVAKGQPEMIKTLILEDSSGLEALLPDTPDDQRLANEGRERRETLFRNLATGNIEMAVRIYVDSAGVAGAWDKLPAQRRQVVLDNLGTALSVEGRPVMTCEQIARFDFPILLLNGERSPKRYGAMYAAMRKCKDIAEPIVIRNAAHSMHRDNAAAFNAAVLGFLARN